ncbi:MAG: heme-dependent peroxidase, partial [Planctomycetota bacterium]
MNRPAAARSGEISHEPAGGGWHCSHLFYSWDRSRLAAMSAEEIGAGRAVVCDTLDPSSEGAPLRLQTSIVSGHKADFALMAMDPDPLKIDRIH